MFKYLRKIDLNQLKYKIGLNYINIAIYLLFFQLVVQPFLYNNYSDLYLEFNNYFFIFNFIANIINTSIFGVLVLIKSKSIKYFLYSLTFYSLLIIFFYDVQIALFAISILMFDIVINIFRLLNKDKHIISYTILNILMISLLIFFLNPYMAYVVSNIFFFSIMLIFLKKENISIKRIERSSFTNKKILFSIINNAIKLSDRYSDKILFLSLNITNKSEILPLIIVGGLVVMPIQLVSKILMSTQSKINIKITTIYILPVFTIIIILYYILKIKYNINILDSYLLTFILIILYKFLNAYNIIKYSSSYNTNAFNTKTIYLFCIFASIFFYLILNNISLSANLFFVILLLYFIALTFVQTKGNI
jgi:hypothetical protein